MPDSIGKVIDVKGRVASTVQHQALAAGSRVIDAFYEPFGYDLRPVIKPLGSKVGRGDDPRHRTPR